MLQSMLVTLVTFLLLPAVTLSQRISDNDGYTGYKLDIRDDGDPLAVVYDTVDTPNAVDPSFPEPDVFLNVCLSMVQQNKSKLLV